MPAPTVSKPRRTRSLFSFRISSDIERDAEHRPNAAKHHGPRRRISMSSIRAWAKGQGKSLHPVSGPSDPSSTLRSQYRHSFTAGVTENVFELDGHPIENSAGPYELSAEMSDDDMPLSKLREKLRRKETFSIADTESEIPEVSSIIAEPSKAAARYRRRNGGEYPASMVEFPLTTQNAAPPPTPFQERVQRPSIFRRPSVSSQALSFMSAPTIMLHPGLPDFNACGPNSWGFCTGCGRDLQSIEERDSEDEDAVPTPAPKPQSPPRKTRRLKLIQRLETVKSREFATETFLQNHTARPRTRVRYSPSLFSVSVAGSEPATDTWSGTSSATASTPLTVPSFRSTRSTTSCPGRRSPGTQAPNCICTSSLSCETYPRCRHRPLQMMHSARGIGVGGKGHRAPVAASPYFGPGPSPGQIVPSFYFGSQGGRWTPLIAQREEWLQSCRIGQRTGMSYGIAGIPAWMRR